MKKKILIILGIIVLLLALGFIYYRVAYLRLAWEGQSMEPNLINGDLLLAERNPSEFIRGDLVAFTLPRGPATLSVKRIIGLPGDKISFSNGSVLINDQKLNENYLCNSGNCDPKTMGDGTFKMNDDEYFVLGDNRTATLDSRMFGSINKSKILGKIKYDIALVLWKKISIGEISVNIPKLKKFIKINDIEYTFEKISNKVNNTVESYDMIDSLLKNISEETILGFSSIKDSDSFWSGDNAHLNTIKTKEITTTIKISDSDMNVNTDKIKSYLEKNGFVEDVNQVTMGTSVGSRGYKKDNTFCRISTQAIGFPDKFEDQGIQVNCGFLK